MLPVRIYKVWPGGTLTRSPVANILRVPKRTIGEESKHHQRFAYVPFNVVFKCLDQARDQGLAGMIEPMSVVASLAVLALLALAVSLVAVSIYSITWVGKVTACESQRGSCWKESQT
jgi:hypothetical protein